MATFVKFYPFALAMSAKKHDLSVGGDTLKIALTNEANPPLVANGVLLDLTPILYTGIVENRELTISAASQALGIATIVIDDYTLTANATVAAFRYVVVYNETAAGDELLGFVDYLSDLILLNGESLDVDFAAASITVQ